MGGLHYTLQQPITCSVDIFNALLTNDPTLIKRTTKVRTKYVRNTHGSRNFDANNTKVAIRSA